MAPGMTTIYRDDFGVAERRLRDALERWAAAREARAGAVRVYTRRVARIAAGAVGTAGALIMGIDARAQSGSASIPPPDRSEPARVLVATWIATALAYAVGRIAAAVVGAASLRRPDATGDPRRNLLRVEAAAGAIEARADRLERASVALPMVAAALLGPLTLHAGFVDLFAPGPWASAMGTWIRYSVLILGHAHLVLAFYVYRFASRARTWSIHDLRISRSAEEWEAYGATFVAAVLPGVVTLMIPTAIAAVTGLVLNPIVYRYTTHAIVAERRVLGVS